MHPHYINHWMAACRRFPLIVPLNLVYPPGCPPNNQWIPVVIPHIGWLILMKAQFSLVRPLSPWKSHRVVNFRIPTWYFWSCPLVNLIKSPLNPIKFPVKKPIESSIQFHEIQWIPMKSPWNSSKSPLWNPMKPTKSPVESPPQIPTKSPRCHFRNCVTISTKLGRNLA